MRDNELRESQKELFEQYNAGSDDTEPRHSPHLYNPSPRYGVSLEQILIFAVVAIVSLIVVFMLGYFKGKTVTLAPNGVAIETPFVQPSKPTLQIRPPSKPVAKKPAKSELKAEVTHNPVASHGKKPYTIQVVTYRTEDRAKKEISTLRAKGFDSQIIKRGIYFEVCAGAYSSTKEAQEYLKLLKQTYKDCYIRQIERV